MQQQKPQKNNFQQILLGQNYGNGMMNQNDEQQFQIYAQCSSKPQDIFFDQVVAALQQIIVNQGFQKLQTNFMKQHCAIFQDTEQNKIQYMPIFKKYNDLIQQYIEKSLNQMVPGFQMEVFLNLLQTRSEQIDQQILQILQSFTDFEIFKQLILDYKQFYQQEERLKLLTIKSNKIPQNKKVKGTGQNNIFSNSNPVNLGGGLTIKPLAPMKNKKQAKQKTEDQLLIPDLVLTVRPLRKA